MTGSPFAAVPSLRTRPWHQSALAALAVVFGLMTLKAGGGVLFGGDAARAAAGHVVPFVLWFNFLAGFAYVAAGLGLWWQQPWAAWLSLVIAAGTLLVFAALGVHIGLGGAYEGRTVAAMTLRSGVWLVIAAASCRHLFAAADSAGCRAR